MHFENDLRNFNNRNQNSVSWSLSSFNCWSGKFAHRLWMVSATKTLRPLIKIHLEASYKDSLIFLLTLLCSIIVSHFSPNRESMKSRKNCWSVKFAKTFPSENFSLGNLKPHVLMKAKILEMSCFTSTTLTCKSRIPPPLRISIFCASQPEREDWYEDFFCFAYG